MYGMAETLASRVRRLTWIARFLPLTHGLVVSSRVCMRAALG
jgi:hypothetical protein